MIQAQRDPRTGAYVVTDAPSQEVARRTSPDRPATPPAPPRARYSPRAVGQPVATYRVLPPHSAVPPRPHLARYWRRYAVAGVVLAVLGLVAWLAYLVVTAVAATASWAATHGAALVGVLLAVGLLLALAGRGSCHTTVTVTHRHGR